MAELPHIDLGGLEVSRLLVGGNPISGFSHQSGERSRQMVDYFTAERIKQLWRSCEQHGITGMVARADAFVMRVYGEYRREGGKLRWVAQSAPEHRDFVANIRQAHAAGASAIYQHGGEADALFQAGKMEEIAARIESIRALGVPAGLAAHDPNLHAEAQRLGMALDYHMVCLYNLTGYRGRRDLEPEEVFDPADRAVALGVLRQLEKPCIAYKVLGAGRLTLGQALSDVRCALRPKDAVLMGMFPPDRPDIVAENVQAVAAL